MNLRLLLSSAACLALLPTPQAQCALAMVPSGSMTSFHHNGDGYLGVDFENLTSQQRDKLRIPSKEGVAIAAVDHDAPAGKAGLRSNDVIVEMNGKKAQHAEDLREALHKMSAGQTLTLNILRDGRPLAFNIVLADRKTVEKAAWSQHYTVPDPHAMATDGTPVQADPKAAAQPAAQTGFLGTASSEIGKTFSSNGGLMSFIPYTAPYTGITVDILTPQLAHYFGLKDTAGLLVKSIDPNSPGSRAGVQAGDVIQKADDTPMTSRSKWSHALRENRHEAVKLQILRNKEPHTLVLTLAAKKS